MLSIPCFSWQENLPIQSILNFPTSTHLLNISNSLDWIPLIKLEQQTTKDCKSFHLEMESSYPAHEVITLPFCKRNCKSFHLEMEGFVHVSSLEDLRPQFVNCRDVGRSLSSRTIFGRSFATYFSSKEVSTRPRTAATDCWCWLLRSSGKLFTACRASAGLFK